MSTAPLEYILSPTYNTSGLPELPSISHILLLEPPRKTILDATSDDFVEETDNLMENVRRKVRLEYILSSTCNTSGLPELPSISHILLVEPPRKTILDTASDDFVEETDDLMENVRRKVRPHRYLSLIHI